MEAAKLAIHDKVKFEEDYFFRNNRTITSSPDIALTELVANAWDAGALNVNITIPDEDASELIIEDDGCGMSDIEFSERWMTLNYNRMKHQGKYASFPKDIEKSMGKACFASQTDIQLKHGKMVIVIVVLLLHLQEMNHLRLFRKIKKRDMVHG